MTGPERIPARNGGSYSDAVVVAAGGVRWIHVAGQTARGPSGGLAAETEACFEQLRGLLEPFGGTLADVVSITVYLVDLAEYDAFAAVRTRIFGDHRPASAAVGVAGLLGGAQVEIAAIAAVPADS